jgi:hypothetical protein
VDIQRQLLLAYDKGVRASGQARRHMRECQGCREYRTQLRGVRRSFASLAPGGGGLLALIGLGSGAASAGGGGAAAAGGSAAAVVGGGAVVATSAKVVAVVASVAVVTAGAAEEVRKRVAPAPAKSERTVVAPPVQAPVAARFDAPAVVLPAKERSVAKARRDAAKAPVVDDAPIREPLIATAMATGGDEVDVGTTGGFVAPDEPEAAVAGEEATTSGSAGAHGPLSLLTGSATGSPENGSAKTETAPGSGSGSGSASGSGTSTTGTSTSSSGTGTTGSSGTGTTSGSGSTSGTGPRSAGGTGSGSTTPGS